jgi:UDP-2,3-diacylglucosamine pyrophosphatase LpxH
MAVKMIMPDLHAPDHDEPALLAFLDALNAINPDELVIIGDFIDCKAPARWSKQTAEEYANTLPGELAAGKTVLRDIRNIYDKPIHFIPGNHEARISSYINTYAPAVSGIVPALPELLGFADYRVSYHPVSYNIAPGVKAIHGKALSSVLGAAGQSAFKERTRHGMSIVQGHSHRLGVGWDRQERPRFWMECGHLYDTAKAGYIDHGVANWQQGFGILSINGDQVFPTVHAIHDGASAFS